MLWAVLGALSQPLRAHVHLPLHHEDRGSPGGPRGDQHPGDPALYTGLQHVKRLHLKSDYCRETWEKARTTPRGRSDDDDDDDDGKEDNDGKASWVMNASQVQISVLCTLSTEPHEGQLLLSLSLQKRGNQVSNIEVLCPKLHSQPASFPGLLLPQTQWLITTNLFLTVLEARSLKSSWQDHVPSEACGQESSHPPCLFLPAGGASNAWHSSACGGSTPRPAPIFTRPSSLCV